MNQEKIQLQEVDQVSVTIVMDNTIDVLMAGTPVAQRYALGSNPFEHPQPLAQHGFSTLVKIKQGGKQGTLLFDTGVSREGLLHNIDVMQINLQCAIVNVRGKGLVVITGCGHAGIINIIRNAQRLTGVDQIHAVIGGFHLTGGLFEPIIPATVAALQKINPRYLMPGHCTGFSATHQLARAMPGAYIPNSVGTTYLL